MSSTPAQARARMDRATVFTAVIAIAPLTLVLVAMTSESWWEGLVIGAAFCAGFLVFYDWAPERVPRMAVIALIFSYAVWLGCALLGLNPLGFFGLALLGGILVPRLRRRQIGAAVGFGALVGATGVLYFIVEPVTWAGMLSFVLIPAGLTIFIAAVILMLDRHRLILRDLERAQQAEAELGIVRERMRFSSDLHDIQGHTLHVVNLKIALAQELLDSDPKRVAVELREVYGHVEETIARTKELAYGHRKLNLASELENAKNLLDAAGIAVRVSRTGEASDATDQLLGQVLREATTNILRHAQAAHVHIKLSASSIDIINDGALEAPLPPLSGLDALRERLAASGGHLSVQQQGGFFYTSAQFPSSTEADDQGVSR